ncbi:unnamed protein product, partial [Rotaria sp. Silwood1]
INDRIIKDIFEHRGVSFANLSKCYGGVTCLNGASDLNKNFIIFPWINNVKQLDDNAIMLAGILTTFLRELVVYLER